MKDFIQINETRIRKSIVKAYKPIGDKRLQVIYNPSRNKPENEVFSFEQTSMRNEVLNDLDCLL